MVKKVDKNDIGIDLFIIEPVAPPTVNGQRVTEILITGRKVDNFYQTGDLQAGKTITITNTNFTLVTPQ